VSVISVGMWIYFSPFHSCVRKAVSSGTPKWRKAACQAFYAAGDASRDVLLVAVAIAEGAKAAVAINRALLKDEGLG